MELTKEEIKKGKKLIKKHLIDDPSPTFVEIILNSIEQDSSFLRVILDKK